MSGPELSRDPDVESNKKDLDRAAYYSDYITPFNFCASYFCNNILNFEAP